MSIVVFDLEVKHSPEEEGFSWGEPWRLGMSVGCTWSEPDGFLDWFEPEAQELSAYLRAADAVVTFNGVRFDYRVVDGYLSLYGNPFPHVLEPALRGRSIDLLLDVTAALGHRVKLDQLAQGTLGETKEMNGALAPAEWAARRRLEVIRYCRHDVEITRRLYEHALGGAPLQYAQYGGNPAGEVRVTWSLR